MAGRAAEWARRRGELIRLHGSLDAVLEPCSREAALLAALAPWRTPNEPPHQRWTLRLDGWDGLTRIDEVAPPLRDAAMGACPMPATFAEACAELGYWRARNSDIEHALSPDGLSGFGDEGLDPVAGLRMRLVQEAVEHAIPLSRLPDIVARLEMQRGSEVADDRILDAVIRDLRAIAGAAGSTG